MRLSTAIKRFDVQLRADGKSEHTRGAYLRDLSMFMGWLCADMDIGRITPNLVARYLASEGFSGSPAICVNRTKTALRMFFKFLTDAGFLEANPARLVKNGRTEPKIPEHLTAQEVRRFLATIPMRDGSVAKRDRVMFTLGTVQFFV